MSKLFIISDIGDYSRHLKKIVNKIKESINENDILLILGDNFYPRGIKNDNDDQIDKFKKMFSEINNKIYMILGNHDYMLNPEAQLNNSNWNMPDWYYNFDYGEYSLYFLDTVQLYPSEFTDGARIKEQHNDILKNLYERQLNWLDKELGKSKKKYKLVFGHYPIITNGAYYYNFLKLYEKLIPLFEKHNVNAYFSGHEHSFQYIKRNINDYTLNHFICGNSGDIREYENKYITKDNNDDIFYNKSYCYMEVNIIDSNLNVYVKDINKELYNFIC